MHLKVINNITKEEIDLGTVTYTEQKIIDSNTERSLHDVYGRPSVYKKYAWNEIESDCQAVHGYGLHITSYNVHFFSTCFYVQLNGVLYAIVDTPSKRVAYTNDSRFNFNGIKVRVYGCRINWTRDNIRALVKPYLKAIGVKKARVDYIGRLLSTCNERNK